MLRRGAGRALALSRLECPPTDAGAGPRAAAPSAHDPREDVEELFDPEDRHRRTHRYRSFPAVNRRVVPGEAPGRALTRPACHSLRLVLGALARVGPTTRMALA